MQEISALKEWNDEWNFANDAVQDAEAMLELAEEGKDESLEQEIENEINKANEILSDLEVKNLLSGKEDTNNAFLTIHSGAGGT